MQPLEKLGELAIVPVVVIKHAEQAVEVGRALLAGGLAMCRDHFPDGGRRRGDPADLLKPAGHHCGGGDCTLRGPG